MKKKGMVAYLLRLPSAVLGAIGFLTRIPVVRGEESWRAFTRTPAAFPLAGYLTGTVIAAPFFLPLEPPLVAAIFLAWIYVFTGIPHIDAVADFGDAMAVQGNPDERRTAMTDTYVGVGAVLSVGLVLVGLWSIGFRIAGLPSVFPTGITSVVLTAEVAAKTSVAAVACFGRSAHQGLGSSFSESLNPSSLVPTLILGFPAAVLTWPNPTSVAGVAGAFATALLVIHWSESRLGGVSGDVMGAANELSRLTALYLGVIVWTRF
ncbi:MAG: adenosylcobinamide-GDP ribazoletransferase [Halobacteria archaeon]